MEQTPGQIKQAYNRLADTKQNMVASLMADYRLTLYRIERSFEDHEARQFWNDELATIHNQICELLGLDSRFNYRSNLLEAL